VSVARSYVLFSKVKFKARMQDDRAEEELMVAAEAVVDAALWCHSLKGQGLVPVEIRQALIEALYRDPSLTPHLFGANSEPIAELPRRFRKDKS